MDVERKFHLAKQVLRLASREVASHRAFARWLLPWRVLWRETNGGLATLLSHQMHSTERRTTCARDSR